MDNNKYTAVLNFINTCPLVGSDTYFNFADVTSNDGNTFLHTVPYSTPYKRYVDGDALWRMQFEVRQIKPLCRESNTIANAETLQAVTDFLNWVKQQGENKNYPDFGENCTIIDLRIPNNVTTPMMTGTDENGALFAFPFEILYFERM